METTVKYNIAQPYLEVQQEFDTMVFDGSAIDNYTRIQRTLADSFSDIAVPTGLQRASQITIPTGVTANSKRNSLHTSFAWRSDYYHHEVPPDCPAAVGWAMYEFDIMILGLPNDQSGMIGGQHIPGTSVMWHIESISVSGGGDDLLQYQHPGGALLSAAPLFNSVQMLVGNLQTT